MGWNLAAGLALAMAVVIVETKNPDGSRYVQSPMKFGASVSQHAHMNLTSLGVLTYDSTTQNELVDKVQHLFGLCKPR